MATKFVTNLDLNQNQLINGRFEVLASDPSSNNFDGRLIFNSTEGTIKVWDDTASEWRKMLTGIELAASDTSDALSLSETNGVYTITVNLASSSEDGAMSAEDKAKLDDATADNTASKLVIRDINGNFKTAAPTDDQHAANKQYVDSARTGLNVKASVKIATTEEIVIATELEEGDVIDGYTLVAGDRVLVKNQSNAQDNGIWIVAETGAPTRAPDADSSAEVTPGMFTFVEQGTLNADSGWVLITDAPIALGSTGLEFSLFSVAGNILAGAALSKTGDVLDVNVDGTSIEIVDDELRIATGAAGEALSWDDGVLSVEVTAAGGLQTFAGDDALSIKLNPAVSGLTTTTDGLALETAIAGDGLTFTDGVISRDTIDLGDGSDDTTGTLPIDQGGTGEITAADARESLAETPAAGSTTSTPVLSRIASDVIGDGTATSYTITHNFNTRAVIVQVYDSATYETVFTDMVRTTADSVTVSFTVAPASGAYTVVVTG